ncbi:MAG: ferredoxin:thioredoxin reductase [Planctomycetota bacterium]|jgi:ferredoxin-thioredoxin reductase catalytic subunit|nr:ferredoxin:thioredoxin reductase [Planctomycetota bacterium]
MGDQDDNGVREVRRRLERHLEGKPFRFNPDSRLVDSILAALVARRKRFGQEYCPCRMVTGDPGRDRDIVCPCVHHEKELAGQGYCHCRLFVRVLGTGEPSASPGEQT